jgi:hypothetical protein
VGSGKDRFSREKEKRKIASLAACPGQTPAYLNAGPVPIRLYLVAEASPIHRHRLLPPNSAPCLPRCSSRRKRRGGGGSPMHGTETME